VSQSPLVSAPGNFVATGLRRSTRLEKSVPLIVLGQNRMGEPFVERTVAVSLNMHGCRYHSRHDYGVGTWVTLQMVGLISSEEKPATVRAMVRSVQPPGSLRELQQVGVELETPANVWGIVSPPADWLSTEEKNTSTAKLAGVIAPANESATKKAGEILMKPEPKVSEITSLPSPAGPPAGPAPKVPEAPRPPRVVVTPDQLISALQGKLQQEAEKAVQAAVAKQVNDVIREAVSSIDDARRSSVREMQELFPKQLAAMKLSLEESAGEMAGQWQKDMQMYRGQVEEIAQRLERQADELRRELTSAQAYVDKLTRDVESSIPTSLKETVNQATSDFESATAVIADRRHDRLLENVQIVTEDALLKLNARSAEVQAFVQSAVNSGLEEFRRETELHVNMTLAETKERGVSALSSLDAESRTICDTRRQALETEVARSAERVAEQFHKGIKAFLYTCLVAAVGAMDEHSKSTLDGLVKDGGKTPDETLGRSPVHDEDEIIPDVDGGSVAH
jgi:hypothetical protein